MNKKQENKTPYMTPFAYNSNIIKPLHIVAVVVQTAFLANPVFWPTFISLFPLIRLIES